MFEAKLLLAESIIADLTDDQSLNIIRKNQGLIEDTVKLLYDNVVTAEITQTIVSSPDLDEVLEVFVRVNSGGIKLSKTDLLFSTITAKWEEAREKIDELIKRIEDAGFDINTDLIMRTCLVLTDLDVLFKVSGFKKENVRKIINKWPDIYEALMRTIYLLQEWSFTDKVLKSKNSIITIASLSIIS